MREAEKVFEIQIHGDKLNQKWYFTKSKIDEINNAIKNMEAEIAKQQALRIQNSSASKAGGVNAVKMSDIKVQKKVHVFMKCTCIIFKLNYSRFTYTTSYS
jgi:hypothetical protein